MCSSPNSLHRRNSVRQALKILITRTMYHDELLVTTELNVKVPPIVDADFEFLQNDDFVMVRSIRMISCLISVRVYLLCVDRKAGYKNRQSNGSGKSLKYSFSSEATSCGLVSESNVFNEPQSSSSRNCVCNRGKIQIEIMKNMFFCKRPIASVKHTSLIRRFDVLTRKIPTTCNP